MRTKNTSIKQEAPKNWRPSFLGTIFAIGAVLCSVLPSLLPRPWFIQGFISGLSLVIGYGVGLGCSSLYRWFIQGEFSHKTKQVSWRVLKVATPLLILGALLAGRVWQNQVRRLLGVEEIGLTHSLLIVLSTTIVSVIFFYLGRMIREMCLKIARLYSKRMPARLGVFLALLSSGFIVYLAVSGILFSAFLHVADSAFGIRDATTPEGAAKPLSANRSGGPGSFIAWDTIGFQGRAFLGKGPTQEQISQYSGTPAADPIRVYAGVASADTTQARADLALAELKRTGAFNRDILVIATATGTGWIDPTASDSLEYMYGGSSAIVSQQYSYLPSWISFLVDQDRAKEAGRVLYDTVFEEWQSLPQSNRPKLVVYGLSLGSFGGQEAFSGVNDIRRSVDGALFTGTPNDTDLWRNITDSRDPGSPEWQPKYKSGKSVVFASSREDIIATSPPIDDTRILFLQHANDPVVWFNFDLLFKKPDWLKEERGRAVSPQTRWYPVITFLQVGLDQAIAASAPIGNGHYYIDTAPHAWATVAPPAGWTTEKSDALQRHIKQ